MGDTNSVENLKKSVSDNFERVDVVVNNAGVTHLPTPLDEVTEEDFDRVFRVNCKSVYLMAKAFVPEMKNQIDWRGQRFFQKVIISPQFLMFRLI